MENATFKFDGMELLTEWGADKYGEYLRKAKRAARRLKNRLEFIHGGRGYDVDEVFGLAYTSSSDFAAVWNTNAEARLAGTRLYFDGIAINTNGETVGVFTERDSAGDEIGTKLFTI